MQAAFPEFMWQCKFGLWKICWQVGGTVALFKKWSQKISKLSYCKVVLNSHFWQHPKHSSLEYVCSYQLNKSFCELLHQRLHRLESFQSPNLKREEMRENLHHLTQQCWSWSSHLFFCYDISSVKKRFAAWCLKTDH